MKNINNKFDESLFKSMNNALKSLGVKNLTKEKYLKGQEKTNKVIKELAKKIKYCNENGHTEGSSNISSGQSGTKVYANCTRCEMDYQRGLTTKEWADFDKEMNTPMTI